ncbi:MAG: hypothetical protein FWE85_00310, partial [Clostridiales bacterium]|nr:hypothetical protein [Clostridiales bacterium]
MTETGKNGFYLGLDIGSTTVKAVILNEGAQTVWACYQRHFSDIYVSLLDVLEKALAAAGDLAVGAAICGSGGLGLSVRWQLPFVQEVIACVGAVEHFIPRTDVAIELGG